MTNTPNQDESADLFENGIPQPGSVVEIITIWDSEWKTCLFQGPVSTLWTGKGTYEWFDVYEKPDPHTRSLPIVLKWRYKQPRRRARAPEGECAYCDRLVREDITFAPPHDASPNCQSGGYNHCTCDTCF